MSQPDLGRVGVWGHLDTLRASEAADYARRVEALGYGALWVPETVGREPVALLGLLAPATRSLVLGTSILGIWGHDAQAARMAAMTLYEATDGRFVLGLGVSHPHLAEKLRGHRFSRPLSRMRAYLAAYRAAVYRGPVRADGGEPLVLVAALREHMTRLAATEADGALPYLATTGRVAWMRALLDAAPGDGSRLLVVTLPVVVGDPEDRAAARAYLKPYLRTPTYHASWDAQGFEEADWVAPASDRLVDAMVAIGPPEELARRISAMHEAGADHVALIPVASDGTTEHAPALEALARVLPSR